MASVAGMDAALCRDLCEAVERCEGLLVTQMFVRARAHRRPRAGSGTRRRAC